MSVHWSTHVLPCFFLHICSFLLSLVKPVFNWLHAKQRLHLQNSLCLDVSLCLSSDKWDVSGSVMQQLLGSFIKENTSAFHHTFVGVPSYCVLPGWSSSSHFEIWGNILRIVEQQDRRGVTRQWVAAFLVLDCFILNFFHMRGKKTEKSATFLFKK